MQWQVDRELQGYSNKASEGIQTSGSLDATWDLRLNLQKVLANPTIISESGLLMMIVKFSGDLCELESTG